MWGFRHITMREDLLERKLAGRRVCGDCGISWNVENVDEDDIKMYGGRGGGVGAGWRWLVKSWVVAIFPFWVPMSLKCFPPALYCIQATIIANQRRGLRRLCVCLSFAHFDPPRPRTDPTLVISSTPGCTPGWHAPLPPP